MSESFNHYILEARDLPIIEMFEWIRRKLMTRIQVKRDGMAKLNGDVCPNIMRKLEKQRHESRNCFPSWAGEDKYEIMHFMQNHIVYLNDKHCSCGMFQMCGFPCCHAVAAINYHRQNLEDFVHPYFKKDTYLRVYSHMINPVPGMHDYEESPLGPVNPPHVVKRVGRPKKARRKDANDTREPTKASRRGLTHTCGVLWKARKLAMQKQKLIPNLLQKVFHIQRCQHPHFHNLLQKFPHSEMPTPPFSQPAAESSPHSEMPTQSSSSIAPPPMLTENIQTSHVPQQMPENRLQSRPLNVPRNLPRMPAYRPPRSQNNVHQNVHQNVPRPPNVHPHISSSTSTCSQNKPPPKASRKQNAPISLSSKLEKRKAAESSSENVFKRQCCPPNRTSISSVLKGVANSYKPKNTIWWIFNNNPHSQKLKLYV
ncbi:UNVERIFIED_CONTAM: hypothetical protein Sradi_2097100 [Sesamum radiatum]|uniref:SWIM-type domain-containing protein n=1 Tax=Sesamum radiatum TaxID=300843 RepID=A0AAW2TI47_SESRA